jgi:lipopolysaccharide assembly outer membrane protein LptD (OstA)
MALIYKTEIPIEDDQNTIHGLEGYYTNSRGDSFGLDYRYNDDENIEQINASFKARLLPVLEAAFEIEHSISEDETNLATVALTYLQQCWSVQLKAQYTPTDERISLVFNLANIGTPFGVNF